MWRLTHLDVTVLVDERDHALLHRNMKVEVHSVTADKPQAIRVANGPAFQGKMTQMLFVIENGVAVRREVKVGLSNFDFVEITENLAPGETVIISDMERYEHLTKIQLP